MNNTYLRLFVAQTKLMTAEKMKLDRFCSQGEFLAYKIGLPPDPSSANLQSANGVKFVFSVTLEDKDYHFTNDNIYEITFSAFEQHLSEFLNELFRRKTEYEKQNEMFREVMEKLVNDLTEDEQHCLATNIDSNTSNVLRALGVAVDND